MTLFFYEKQGIRFAHNLDVTPSPDDFILHAHNNCELYYFIKGDGYYTVEGNNYPLSGGSILIMCEGEAHTLHINPVAQYERITINFPYEAVDKDGKWTVLHNLFYNRELGKNNMFSGDDESKAFVRAIFNRMCSNDTDDNNQMNTITSGLKMLMCELICIEKKHSVRYDAVIDVDVPVTVKNVDKKEALLVLDIIEYINNNLSEIENLNEVESQFFFSRSYINRVFKKATGSSVWNYIILKRLIAARSLLRKGIPASVAASRCGFRDYSSFYKQYKQKFGTPPIAERAPDK